MRTIDLSPFYRSTVGFDRFRSTLSSHQLNGVDSAAPSDPPENTARTGATATLIASPSPSPASPTPNSRSR